MKDAEKWVKRNGAPDYCEFCEEQYDCPGYMSGQEDQIPCSDWVNPADHLDMELIQEMLEDGDLE